MLLIHETPYLPELFPFMRDDFTSRTAKEAVRIVRSKLVVNGHMHSGGCKIFEFPWGARYIYISSDQRERCYLVIGNDNVRSVEVWRGFEKVNALDV